MVYYEPMVHWHGREVVEASPSSDQLLRFSGYVGRHEHNPECNVIEEFTKFCQKHNNITGLVLTNPHQYRHWGGRDYKDSLELQGYSSYWEHPEIGDMESDFWHIGIALLENKEALQKLEHLFLNDDLEYFSEVSYLCITNPMLLLAYFPNLKSFGWRGRPIIDQDTIHESLEYLEIQGTGLSKDTLRTLRDRTLFPALKGLTCYFGDTEAFTWDDHTEYALGKEDLLELVRGDIYPNLTHIGLCNMPYDAEIAQAIVDSPLPLESLSLACSTIDDNELVKLLVRRKFKTLDVQDTYVSMSLSDHLILDGLEVFNNEVRSKHTPHVRYSLHHE